MVAFDPGTGAIVYTPSTGVPALNCAGSLCSCPTMRVTVTGSTGNGVVVFGYTMHAGDILEICPDTYQNNGTVGTVGTVRNTWRRNFGTVFGNINFAMGGGTTPAVPVSGPGFECNFAMQVSDVSNSIWTSDCLAGSWVNELGNNAVFTNTTTFSPQIKWQKRHNVPGACNPFAPSASIGTPFGGSVVAVQDFGTARPTTLSAGLMSSSVTVSGVTIATSRGADGNTYAWGDLATSVSCTGSDEVQ